jgi:hypothetical protein
VENSMEAPQKPKNRTTIYVIQQYNSLGIYWKECKSDYNKGTCTPVFIAALFTIAKIRKQLRCLTTDEWIKKMWYLYKTEFYWVIKKNEILLFVGKWIELENIILS